MNMTSHRQKLIELGEQRGATAFVSAMKAMPSVVGMHGRIANISISPVKSLGMLVLNQARVGRRGLRTNDNVQFEDRTFMIVQEDVGKTEQGEYSFSRYSQRECGKLVLARPILFDGMEALCYQYETRDMPMLTIVKRVLRPSLTAGTVAVRLSKQTEEVVYGQLENGPITDWIRMFLSKSGSDVDTKRIHVLRESLNFDRMVDPMHACGQNARTIYSDGGKVTIASLSTLNTMNEEFEKSGTRKVPASAFRMNLLLADLPPFAEYLIGSIMIQSVDGRAIPLDFGGSCVRCDVTRVEQHTGEKKPDGQPLKWLRNNLPGRSDAPNKVTFGFNCAVSEEFAGSLIKSKAGFSVSSEKE